MRILLLSETIPAPLDSGGRIRTFHTLRLLSSAHEVHCHAFIRHDHQRRYLELLAPHCSSATLHLWPSGGTREVAALGRSFAGAPFSIARHFDRRVAHQLEECCRALGIDLLYCDHLSMVQYAQRLRRRFAYDAHNVESMLVSRHAALAPWWSPLRLAGRLEANRLLKVERRACQDASLVLALSDADAAALRRLAPGATIETVPVAIDVEALDAPRRIVRDPRLLFVGGLHWPPNLEGLWWFLREVWPAVRRRLPDAEFTVVGRASNPERRALERHPGVTATGAVDDLGPWMGAARAMVAPLLSGGGVRVKILDAFARRVPVAATEVGWEGIAAVPGRHLLSARTGNELAEAVVRLLSDDALADALAAEGHALVSQQHSLRRVGRSLLEAVGKLGKAEGQPAAD